MKNFRLILVIASLALLAAAPAHAVWFWGTKPLGMGTAFTAVADDNNAMQANPAGIGQIKAYSIDVNYERREYEIRDYPQLHQNDQSLQDDNQDDFGSEVFNDQSTDTNKHEKNISDFWHASVVDGKTSPGIAAGLSFTAANFPTRTFVEGKDYRAALAIAGGMADILYIGGAVKYAQLEPGETNVNGDFGALVNAADIISVGLVGRNVFGSQDAYKIEREVALGVAGHILDYATVSFDTTKIFDVVEDSTFNFALGAEGFVYRQFRTKSGLALRGGFNWDQVYGRDNYSFGIAWAAPEGTLAYGFRGDIANTRDFQHSLEINLKF